MADDAQPLLARAGNVLFRWRSVTPLPALLLLAPLVARSRGAPPLGPAWAWTALALAVGAVGEAVRAWTIGLAPDGTSGQNEVLIADVLSTAGPYRHVRNPLYVGNLLLVASLALAAHAGAVALGALAFFALQYAAIVAAEEAFLAAKFSDAYARYRAAVPRWLPRLSPARADRAPLSFRPARALRKEHNPAAAWLLGVAALAAWDAFTVGEPTRTPVTAMAAVALAWLGVKAWKHRWLAGGFAADLSRRWRALRAR